MYQSVKIMEINGLSADGKKFSYLIGLLLTDGYFTTFDDNHIIKGKLYSYRRKRVGIGVIDKELAISFKEGLQDAFNRNPKVKISKQKGHKNRYIVEMQHKPSVTFLEELTKGRTDVPDFILNGDKEIKLSFIAGIMDGDGWISKVKDRRGLKNSCGWQFMIGFCGHDRKYEQALKIMESVGIKLRSHGFKKNKNIVTRVVNINIRSFIDSGAYFKCLRKQERLSFYRELIYPISETTKTTHLEDVKV